MFFALAKGKVSIEDYEIDHVMQDIENLNQRALTGELDVSAISAAVYPQVAETYRVMACGASVGRNYGPLLIAKKAISLDELEGKTIGVPGTHTTANLLLNLYVTDPFESKMMHFDTIMDAIAKGDIDAGVIIHEGQLTWERSGFTKILDLGKAWTQDTHLPIPLGLDVIHRRLGEENIQMITEAFEKSIRYALEHEDEAIDYAIQFGRGLDRDTCRRFVRMYVNDDTENMGEEGRVALQTLYARASGRGLVSSPPSLDIVGVK